MTFGFFRSWTLPQVNAAAANYFLRERSHFELFPSWMQPLQIIFFMNAATVNFFFMNTATMNYFLDERSHCKLFSSWMQPLKVIFFMNSATVNYFHECSHYKLFTSWRQPLEVIFFVHTATVNYFLHECCHFKLIYLWMQPLCIILFLKCLFYMQLYGTGSSSFLELCCGSQLINRCHFVVFKHCLTHADDIAWPPQNLLLGGQVSFACPGCSATRWSDTSRPPDAVVT
jgi:hypothetical protein